MKFKKLLSIIKIKIAVIYKRPVSRINQIKLRLKNGQIVSFEKLKFLNESTIQSVIKYAGPNFSRHGVEYETGQIIEREIYFLKLLEDEDHFPRILATGKDFFEMTFSGNRINKNNIPDDYDNQIIEIATSLEKFKITHRDIKQQNLLVNNRRLILIDFGWAVHPDKHSPCPQDQEHSIPKENIYNNLFALQNIKQNL